MQERSIVELVLRHMTFSWWSALAFAYFAVMLFIIAGMALSIGRVIDCLGFGSWALMFALGAVDMFFVNNLKKERGPVTWLLRKILF